ncbi:MAG: UbiX family flavin prenyltransferase [Legionellales bacterium]|nr:UbiX family flavin prenyltransferase [Legionellales bacterium]
MKQRIIVGISGASGFIYGYQTLAALQSVAQVETHLVMSSTAQRTRSIETSFSQADVEALADVVHKVDDFSASISSGSFVTAGMIMAPCSMRSLAEIASGVTTSLLTRAADVVLKERRRLVLMVRESPIHSGHLQSMLTVSQWGGIIAPPVPAFYIKPETLDDIVAHSVGKVLDLFGVTTAGLQRWKGTPTDK